MTVANLPSRLAALLDAAGVPQAGARPAPARPVGLHPFAFASEHFAPPLLAAAAAVAAHGPGDQAADLLAALADLLEETLAGGDDWADSLAMRVVYQGLVTRPGLLAATWPFLGPRAREVADRFRRLVADCDARESAAQAGVVSPGTPTPLSQA